MRILTLFLVLPSLLFAQAQSRSDAATIKARLKKLDVLASVLYVAAHPDDENTRIIAALANGQLAETAYLSMTRGDGGQNLVGPEMRDLLGLIRTYELLAARGVDGGRQFFTRANDFGYSKSAEETFEIWGKEEVLHDVIKIFRQFQPDVIITRFPPDERAGHGHHTASAMLAIEAFDKAADRASFPAQLQELQTWQSRRLFINTGRWWNNSINEETPGIVSVDVGGYNPLLGSSYSEIAAVSRSQHKSQGFGSRGSRGRQLEFLEFQKGQPVTKDVFEGINTTWSRIPGSGRIQELVKSAINSYEEDAPHKSIAILLQIRSEILKLSPSVWKERKLKDVEELIQDCAGLYLETTADQYWVAPGEQVRLSFELVNRAPVEVSVSQIQIPGTTFDSSAVVPLKHHIPIVFHSTKTIDASIPYSGPYWLKEPHGTGLFTVRDNNLIGKAESDAALNVRYTLHIGNESITTSRPVVYKWTDPVKGELSRPFEIVPPVFVTLMEEVMIFRDESPKPLSVLVKSSSRKPLSGSLQLRLPEGWRSEPATIPVSLTPTGEEQTYSFTVFPSAKEITGSVTAFVTSEGNTYDQSVKVIAYDHIPTQTLLLPATTRAVRVNLNSNPRSVGYIAGAGDDIPAALRHMGYEVVELANGNVSAANLARLDAVVLGVRALNTNERLKYAMPDLFAYVQNGGTLVVQYNTSFNMVTDAYSPFPLTISRDRVSQEDAPVTILKPDHPVMNTPNKITATDFNNWIQERGLYFPGTWDANFEAVLSMHDKGEDQKNGSLLIAPYGKGFYVYTGLSFFRQLPEGVAGAYKLFDNIVSLGTEQAPGQANVIDNGKKRKSKKR